MFVWKARFRLCGADRSHIWGVGTSTGSPSSQPNVSLGHMSSFLDQSALSALAERLVDAARRAGADAADAMAARSISLSVEVRDGTVEESERAEGDSMGLRVLVGRRQAVVSTNDIAGESASALADPALRAKSFPELDLLDPELPSVPDLERMAKAAEAAGVAVKGVSKSGGASAGAGIGGVVLVTGHGSTGAYLGSHHSMSMMAIAGEGTAMERDYDFSSALHASDLEAPEQIGLRAGERAAKRLNPRKVPSGRVPIVFEPRVAGSIVGHLASGINGASIARKASFLQDKLGEQLFADGITIIDDPLRKRGLRSHPFDAEGIAPQRRALVDNGVVKTWLLDCATARELELTTTGHASRGVSSTPSPSPTNLHLEPGKQTPAQLIADIDSGFYVTDLIGMGVNMVTGDYSRGASGFWIERGEIVYPVSEVTIAGHLLDVFKGLTPANDLAFRYGTNAPTVRMEGLTVAGL